MSTPGHSAITPALFKSRLTLAAGERAGRAVAALAAGHAVRE